MDEITQLLKKFNEMYLPESRVGVWITLYDSGEAHLAGLGSFSDVGELKEWLEWQTTPYELYVDDALVGRADSLMNARRLLGSVGCLQWRGNEAALPFSYQGGVARICHKQ